MLLEIAVILNQNLLQYFNGLAAQLTERHYCPFVETGIWGKKGQNAFQEARPFIESSPWDQFGGYIQCKAQKKELHGNGIHASVCLCFSLSTL